MYLKNSQLTLCAIEPEDLDTFYRWENDATLWEFGNTLAPYSRYVLREYIASSHQSVFETQQLRLMVTLTATGEVIGAVDLFDFDAHHLRAGIGVLTDQAYRGKGYGAAALRMLAEYAFGFLHLNQLYCHVPTDHGASIHMVERVGFRACGELKGWIRRDKGYADVTVFQLLAGDFSASR